MNLALKDRVVLITGGAKGIGSAAAHLIGEEGGIPVIVDRDKPAGDKLRHELRQAGMRCSMIGVELDSAVNCLQAVEQAVQEFGQLDALINNAGVNDRVGLEHGSPEQYLGSLQRNLLHYYSMAHYALPHLKRSKGSILNVASKTAITGQGGTSGYASAKGAILALTREWAVELLPYGIRVNAVVPAEVMTDMYRQWLGTFPNAEQKLQKIVSNIPLGKRMTTAEELASMIVFLISERAQHITGQHVFVDGGYVHLDRAIT
ncbi:MAG TPA: SDR family oxidoreductase [Candidatus Sulfotelmatobacter sp.]|jgi:L-fucose dehydrogenase|nr:SDR family oxidoreductase [Candidatus Sulfotelmatobacter sp.]